MNTKLSDLRKEPTFWILLAISAPGIIASYVVAILAVVHGTQPDTAGLLLAATGSPIGLYLGLGRQFARGKAIEAHGAIQSTIPVESNPMPGEPEVVPMGVNP